MRVFKAGWLLATLAAVTSGCVNVVPKNASSVDPTTVASEEQQAERNLERTAFTQAVEKLQIELRNSRLPTRKAIEQLNAEPLLPSPSDIAALPASAGAPRGEVRESLLNAARTYQQRARIHADNLANSHTTGYKALRPIVTAGTPASPGSHLVSVRSDPSQGAMQNTNRPLDIAIEGKGFLEVTDDVTGNVYYTRAGHLSLTAHGVLSISGSKTGRLVSPSITIPSDATMISISPDGTVGVRLPGDAHITQIGGLQLCVFGNPDYLRPVGDNLYAETDESGIPICGSPGEEDTGTIRQGYLEGSNVEPIEELMKLQKYLRTLHVIRWLLIQPDPADGLRKYQQSENPG